MTRTDSPDLAGLTWRKSTLSSGQGECVETAVLPDRRVAASSLALSTFCARAPASKTHTTATADSPKPKRPKEEVNDGTIKNLRVNSFA